MLLVVLVINIYSLIGIPPLIGFFGKQMVISGGLLGGYVGLVTIGIITSVVSGGYYLRLIREVILKKSKEGKEEKEGKIGGARKNSEQNTQWRSWVISIITLCTVLYVLNPRLIMMPISIMVN